MMHRTENDISATSPGGIVPGLFLQVEQKAGEIATTKKASNFRCSLLCGKGGIRTPGASQHGGFQDRCNRPLYHLSNA